MTNINFYNFQLEKQRSLQNGTVIDHGIIDMQLLLICHCRLFC